MEYWKTVRAKVTAYEPSAHSCGRFADGRTSVGDDAYLTDGCAVAPNAIPYRSVVHIPGVGFREADDTGSAMRTAWKNGVYHVDVRMPSVEEAKRWGVRTLDLKLYKKAG